MTTKYTKLSKPYNWRFSDWDAIISTEAGLSYLAWQVGGEVDPEVSFVSNDIEYRLFSDGSVLIAHKTSLVENVYSTVNDAMSEMHWKHTVIWERLDTADREFLRYCFGDDAEKVFKSWVEVAR